MAVQSTPYVETALSHSAELFRRELQSSLPFGSAGGIVPATPGTSDNVSAGVTGFTDLEVVAPASGMSVNVNAGQIIVPGSLGSSTGYGMGTGYGAPTVTLNGGSAPTVAATAHATQVTMTTQGAYYCYNDDSAGAVNLAITAADPSNPRIDVVIAQVEDAAYSGSNNDWKLAVVTGTAAASPTVPTLPASCMALAYVWVPANATSIVAADILDLRIAYNRNPFTCRMALSPSVSGPSGHTIIPFQGIYFDIAGMCTTGTGAKITIPVSGEWQLSANVYLTAAASGVSYIIPSIAHNGTVDFYRFCQTAMVANEVACFGGSISTVLNEGDYVQIDVDNSGTGTCTIGATGFDGVCSFSAQLLSPI